MPSSFLSAHSTTTTSTKRSRTSMTRWCRSDPANAPTKATSVIATTATKSGKATTTASSVELTAWGLSRSMTWLRSYGVD